MSTSYGTLAIVGMAAAMLVAHHPPASAQKYPAKPVRVIVPFAPGGISDLLARITGQKLADKSVQPFIVDNRPGAGGNLGTELAAKAVADGYTLLFVSPSFAISPSLYHKLGYDPVRDFAPVSLVALATNLVVVHPSIAAASVKELIASARAPAARLYYGSGGSGTSGQLAAELFNLSAGVKLVHVGYKGAGPAVNALLGGEVQVMFAPITLVLPQVHAGRLKAVAVTGARRSAAAPNIPTIAESGLPGFDVSSWFGFVAPARTPTTVVAWLRHEIAAALKSPDVGERVAAQGAEPASNTSEEFARHIGAEIAKWAEVVKRAGIRAQ